MENLQFDTGIKEFALNGNENAVIRINPTDTNQVQQLYNVLIKMGEKQNEYEERIKASTDAMSSFKVFSDMDKEIREMIDGVFGKNFSKNAFGNMNLYAYGDGLPVWFNFIDAVIEMFDTKLKEVEKERNPRVEQYLKKYR